MTGTDQSELVIVLGKGGTGRTTVAAALALGAARRGRRTIVCEVGGQAQIPRLLDPDAPAIAAGTERRVAPGLWATSIDPDVALREWLASQIPRAIAAPLLRSGAFSAFVGAAPGARELVAITKAWELGSAKRWRRGEQPFDTVILDAPASGHGLGMLRTPRTYAELARVGPIASQARAVAETLRDPGRTRLVAVALPAELPVNETLELEPALAAALDRDLDAIVVNGLWPRRLSTAEARRLDELGDAPLRRTVAAATQGVRTQQTHLARLRREARGPISTLPFVFTPDLEIADVDGLSTRLDALAS
jgi:anion-transporting  ArsA/GET3 family ATPase